MDEAALRGDLERLVETLGLESVSIQEVTELDRGTGSEPTHIVSVYGVDHPGIVHSVASALGQRAVNITDLHARVAGEASGRLYSMVLEVALPDGLGEEELEAVLSRSPGSRAWRSACAGWTPTSL